MTTFEHEINNQPVLVIHMDATDSTECITNCVISMRIHIHNNDKKAFVNLILSLSNTYDKFGGGKVTLGKDSADIWIHKESVQQHILKGLNVLCLIKLNASLALYPILLNG